MNLSSISSTSSLASLTNVRPTSSSVVDALQSTDDTTSLSGPAALSKKLEALSKSDPAKFKEAVNTIAKKLNEAADAATNPHEKEMLTDMASKFTKAGETGDASDLKPSGRPPAGGPPPGGAPPGGAPSSGGSGASSKSQYYDPADTNQDGKVSLQEQAAYDAKQASKKEDSTGLGAYKQALHSAADQKAASLMASLNSIVDSVTKSCA